MLERNYRHLYLRLDHVSKLLQRLTFCGMRYERSASGDELFDDPFHELFIYCIIFNRFDASRIVLLIVHR